MGQEYHGAQQRNLLQALSTYWAPLTATKEPPWQFRDRWMEATPGKTVASSSRPRGAPLLQVKTGKGESVMQADIRSFVGQKYINVILCRSRAYRAAGGIPVQGNGALVRRLSSLASELPSNGHQCKWFQ